MHTLPHTALPRFNPRNQYSAKRQLQHVEEEEEFYTAETLAQMTQVVQMPCMATPRQRNAS